ncbi:hypothetical protein EZV62_007852 [Acer yangbiense]|uniref:CCHC-type domain-containing protein n=1 Tax=Acer yangbiense TaxID=1000413 RepID=A0A5C7IBI6_9ROSI|nr:hypothetical protein EZV62_007852 [Acer yangbiense]
MFYFIKQEDRNRVWNRGPWHFGNSLIVLEKPVGSRNIAQLGFNKADLWVQIHDLLIMCMNRRTAKWLAEQLGEVVELPTESRECWGKFMRVKVRIDISKALKRWIKLKLGKSEEVTTMNLKYERLPEFCFACGKIGHGIKECQDVDARNTALEGSQNKFGSWLKASIPNRLKPRSGVYNDETLSKRTRSMAESQESEGDRSVSLKQRFGVSQIEKRQNDMVIDGPGRVTEGDSNNLGLSISEPTINPPMLITEPVNQIQDPSKEVSPPSVISQPIYSNPPSLSVLVDSSKASLAAKKKITKRWKRSAREVKSEEGRLGLIKWMKMSGLVRKRSVLPLWWKTIYRWSLSYTPLGNNDRPQLERSGTEDSPNVRGFVKAAKKVFSEFHLPFGD